MSSYTARRIPRKRNDMLPIFLLLVSMVALPVLGFVGWKIMNKKPVVTHAPVVAAKTSKSKVRHYDFNDPNTSATGDGSTATPFGSMARVDYGQNPGYVRASQPGSNSWGSSGGGGRSSTTDSSQALDRIGSEIRDALSLPKKVLVVWLFDETASAAQLREDVVAKLPGLYGKLGVPAPKVDATKTAAAGDDSPVLSLVAQYGDDVKFLTEQPVASAAEVEAAVGKLQAGSGHVENTMTAVQAAAERAVDYRKKKNRYVTIVVVTDEAGDDRGMIDAVLPKLALLAMPVQVIGPSAMFGQSAPDDAMSTVEGTPPAGEVWVTHGSDAHDADWIKLDFPSGGSGERDFDIKTGLGPYALTRLCKQTEGKYFVTSGGGEDAGLRGFEPPYISEDEYAQQVQGNKAKRALIDAAKLKRVAVQTNLTSSFGEGDDVGRIKMLDSSQKPVAKVMPMIDELYTTLKSGEADLPKLAGNGDKRWRAAFELALGRAGAAKVRHQGYIEMTAQMKGGRKFQDPSHTTWSLEPSNDPMGISVLDKMATKSRDYLNHIVKEYANTPWAKAAERELQTPIGFKWTER